MANNKKLEFSILAINAKDKDDFANQIARYKNAHITAIHYDVMDGNFVPNKAYGPEYLKMLYLFGFETNVHLMVKHPYKYLKEFLVYPFNAITFHPEPISKFQTWLLLKKVKLSGRKCGLAFKPETNLTKYKWLIKQCDYITVMGVPPGFGGSKFIGTQALKNLQYLHYLKQEAKHNIIIQLDGGVNYEVIDQTKEYVDNYVSGTFVAKQKDPHDVVEYIKKL